MAITTSSRFGGINVVFTDSIPSLIGLFHR